MLEHRFRKIEYDSSGHGNVTAVVLPTIQGGAPIVDEEMYEMEQLGRQGIRVKTDLEQNYGTPIPARENFT